MPLKDKKARAKYMREYRHRKKLERLAREDRLLQVEKRLKALEDLFYGKEKKRRRKK